MSGYRFLWVLVFLCVSALMWGWVHQPSAKFPAAVRPLVPVAGPRVIASALSPGEDVAAYAWDLCDDVTVPPSWFEHQSPPGRLYVVGADVNDGTFPIYPEPRAQVAWAGPGRGGYRIPAANITALVARVLPSTDWVPCTVHWALGQDVLECQGVKAQAAKALAGHSHSAVQLRENVPGGTDGLTLPLCRRRMRLRPAPGGATASAMCVAFAFGEARPNLLAEFVEHHLLMGVTHIFVYDKHGSYGKAARALGLRNVTVIPWKILSHDPQNDPRSDCKYDQIPAQFHCMWNARRKYDVVWMADFDEWLVPTGAGSVPDAVYKLIAPSKTACVTFGVIDIGPAGGVFDKNRMAVEQLRWLAETTSWPKQACIPERVWGSRIHYAVAAEGFSVHHKPVPGMLLAHLRALWRKDQKVKNEAFDDIWRSHGPALKERLKQYGF